MIRFFGEGRSRFWAPDMLITVAHTHTHALQNVYAVHLRAHCSQLTDPPDFATHFHPNESECCAPHKNPKHSISIKKFRAIPILIEKISLTISLQNEKKRNRVNNSCD